MAKKFVLAVIAIFIAWSVMDFVIHGLILRSTYEATAHLWRPMHQMKVGLMYMVTMVAVVAFAGLYAAVVTKKSLGTGITYGLLYGVATGFPMGFGSYCVMPIPIYLAVVWFVGTLAEAMVGGAIVGAIIRPAGSRQGNNS